MAATQTVPASAAAFKGAGPTSVPANAPVPVISSEPGTQRVTTTAVVPVGAESMEARNSEAGSPDSVQLPFNPVIARLPVELDVMVSVRQFRVRKLLALAPGDVIESQWSHGEDVPVAAGAVVLAWSEFEVIDNQLAVRITRLP